MVTINADVNVVFIKQNKIEFIHENKEISTDLKECAVKRKSQLPLWTKTSLPPMPIYHF